LKKQHSTKIVLVLFILPVFLFYSISIVESAIENILRLHRVESVGLMAKLSPVLKAQLQFSQF